MLWCDEMDTALILNGIDIHDIDMLIENITDRDGLLGAFRDGSLHFFLKNASTPMRQKQYPVYRIRLMLVYMMN